MSSGIKKTWKQAMDSAQSLRKAFLASRYLRWEFAGSLRRGKATVGDVEHVIVPVIQDAPAESLFGGTVKLNLVWQAVDEYLRNGLVSQHLYTVGERGLSPRWGQRYRGMDYQGLLHEFYMADENNFGAVLAIRTGPGEFSKMLVIKLRDGGYEAREGYVWKQGELVPVPDERTFFRLAGVPWVEPKDRR